MQGHLRAGMACPLGSGFDGACAGIIAVLRPSTSRSHIRCMHSLCSAWHARRRGRALAWGRISAHWGGANLGSAAGTERRTRHCSCLVLQVESPSGRWRGACRAAGHSTGMHAWLCAAGPRLKQAALGGACAQVISCRPDQLVPANPVILDGIADLTGLTYLNEPSILHGLNLRYGGGPDLHARRPRAHRHQPLQAGPSPAPQNEP